MGKEQESPFSCTSLINERQTRGEDSPRFFNTIEELAKKVRISPELVYTAKKVQSYFPVRIPSFYVKLMDFEDPFCPIKRQAIPSSDELSDSGFLDPLGEEKASLTPSFIKKYRGRGVFLVSSECAMFCRFCNRKRLVGRGFNLEASWEQTFNCIENISDLHEIILSGGDPFMLSPEKLSYILERLLFIKKIKTIRISTRVPVVCPEALREEHIDVLSNFSPIWIVIHINHPKEITEPFKAIIKKFQRIGLTIVSQTVLLRGVNDCAMTLIELFENLVSIGIKPYYLFQLDEVIGAHHFKVRLSHGIKIYKALRKHASGLAVPLYMVDISGGLGKVPVIESIVESKDKIVFFKSFDGKVGPYMDDGYESKCSDCGVCEKI